MMLIKVFTCVDFFNICLPPLDSCCKYLRISEFKDVFENPNDRHSDSYFVMKNNHTINIFR